MCYTVLRQRALKGPRNGRNRVSGLGFRILGLGVGVWVLGCRADGLVWDFFGITLR